MDLEEENGGPYTLQISREKAIDAARMNAAPGRWANDPRGSGKRANGTFALDRRTGTARVRASRRIMKGEEVLVSYGRGYWKGAMVDQQPVRRQENVTGIAVVDVVGELLKECEKDEAYVERRNEIVQKGNRGDTVVEGGLIRENGVIVLPDTERAKVVVTHECHDSTTAGISEGIRR